MRKPKRAKAAKKSAKTIAKSLTKTLAKTPAKGGKTRPVEAKPDDTKATIRNLRTKLAQALRRIDELEAAADTDFLLGIPNRRGFERELHRAIAYMKRYRASGALIVLDVDRLKPINDSFGHAAGDEVLKTIAATLTRHVRSSDVVGRLGGDEFALLLWNLTETDAKAKAAGFEEAIDELSFTFRGQRVNAGASAGVALLGSHAEAGRALEEADAAMYVRKAQRRHEPQIRIVAG
ncbi:GGDEF domain-containing protein [Bradyrhizobium liaoningense]|uniref:GGDEF domain-containing protein n=1 Tax=Bradyrhizobium liaoningense TaxID=43992 RepID=UPI001BA71D14|nr:GGDEF domain-containing protein [Bradyrhizobium liaoningense]MBR0718162.1 GGDEF domain-containing protein [Bradyrhizobium liaoningense]